MNKKSALCVMTFFLSIPFLITGVAERGAVLYHSSAVGSGLGYKSSIHIFNPNTQPTEYQLRAFSNSGAPSLLLTDGLTITHMFTGTLAPLQSIYYQTADVGLGANAGNLQLLGFGDLAAWSQTSQANSMGDEAARETTALVNVNNNAWVLPRVQTFASSPGPNPTVGYIGLRNIDGAEILQLDLIDVLTGDLAAARTIGIGAGETIFSSVGDLMGVADLNKEYLLRTQSFSVARVLPYYMAIADGRVLAHYLGTTGGFSSTLLRGGSGFTETLPFFHLGMDGVNADYSAVSTSPGVHFTGTVELHEASVPGPPTPVSITEPSAFFDASAALSDPGVDEFGTVAYNDDNSVPGATGHIRNANASTLFGPSQRLGGRGAISLDASQLDGLDLSRLILHNHQSTPVQLAIGLLDEAGAFLQVINQSLDPGLTVTPLFDLVANLPDTRTLLIETSPVSASVTADLIVHGGNTALIDGEILDRVPTVALGGNRTIGNYPEILIAWANSNASSCFGSNTTVRDIVNFLGNGYTCP